MAVHDMPSGGLLYIMYYIHNQGGRNACYLRRGERSPEEDASIGGHLLRVRDGAGAPLPFARLWSELSIFFMAGMETTAHAITWALCVLELIVSLPFSWHNCTETPSRTPSLGCCAHACIPSLRAPF